MKIKELKNKNIWEDFLLQCEDKTFLQSWNWGDFNEVMGNKIWRLGVYDEHGGLSSVALTIKIAAKRGTFLLIQHGPTIIQSSKVKNQNCPLFPHSNSKLKIDVFSALLKKLKEIGKKEGASFIRVNPMFERNSENQNILEALGFKKAQMHANAYEATWKLNIDLPEEELLANMRKTTRYLIRQAQKNSDIEISKSNEIEDVALFDKLNKEVAKHQRFVPFSFNFVKNEFNILSKDNQVLLFFGKYKGEIVASALVVFWSGIAFYHQAALSPKYHKVPVAYLLQWEAIKEAKERGCKLYDFWGFVDPQKNPSHPWAGPTLFKMGFSGKLYEYVKTQDLPLSWKYWLTFIFEKLRKIKRSL